MPNKHRYWTLDGLRGIAALFILARHNPAYFGKVHFNESFLAVDLFFALSGFVVAEAYAQRLRDGLGWRAFMRLRLIRFYPLYLLGTLLGLGVALGNAHLGREGASLSTATILGSMALNLVFAPSLFAAELYPFLIVAWSLFWELIANLAYGLTQPFLNRRTLYVCILASLLSFALVLPRTGIDSGWALDWTSAWMAATRVLFSFSMGLLLHQLPRSRFRLPPILAVGLAGLALGLNPEGDVRFAYEMAFVLVVSPLLVYLGAGNEPKRPLEISAYTFLGDASYATYVLHMPLGKLLSGATRFVTHRHVADFAPWSGVALIFTLLILCHSLNRFYDAPLRRWLTAKAPASA